MKKLLFVFAFMGMFAMVSEAQTKSCSKSCAKACEKKSASAEAKAASLDPSIEARTETGTNETYYVRKVSGTGGSVSYDKVEYCSKEGKFVNVSPKGKACCSKEKSGSACCAKKGSTTADATSK
jgi:hypothetical protein